MKKILTIIISILLVLVLGVAWKLGEKKIGEPISAKDDLIRVTTPLPNQEIKSPLVIKGEARGNWFFEATFPFELIDGDGKVIARSFATARGEWMTTEFVPFEATAVFSVNKSAYGKKGVLVLRKSNASGLPEHDDSLIIPVIY